MHACAQAAYDERNDERLGNGAIVKALVEMEKYWDALEVRVFPWFSEGIFVYINEGASFVDFLWNQS